MGAIGVTVVIERGEQAYSAVCLELGVASQGASLDEARKNILEAITLYLETCQEQGMTVEQMWHPVPEELRAGLPIQPPRPATAHHLPERWAGHLVIGEHDSGEAAASPIHA